MSNVLLLPWADPPSAFRSSPRANITLSGKKRRKLLKQLQHEQKTRMEGDRTPNLTLDPAVAPEPAIKWFRTL